tara:strand:+ start:433 stop:852 length:420 start_codon:yes stop_codon:yes gene_type:complete
MTYKIIGKYIKDLYFNIPNAKTFFLLSKDIENYKINIDIKSDRVEKNIIEVFTTLSLSPTRENIENINTKIIYATVVELLNNKMKKEDLEKIVLIEIPSIIYEDLRKIFINLFESSGFKDIKINEKIDFQQLYNRRRAQ